MKRAIPSLVIGLAGVALFTFELIHVFNIGTCASGAPFLSARPCPSGTGTVVLLLALGIILGVVGRLIGMGQTGLFIWCALFAASGGAMLIYSLTGHGGAPNSTGYVLGAVFIPMGALPLLWMMGNGADSLRQRRLRARSKQADATVSRVEELQRYGFNQASIRVTYAVRPLDDAPSEALASLEAVTRAASESAVAGAPSAIPAIPSVPCSDRRAGAIHSTGSGRWPSCAIGAL